MELREFGPEDGRSVALSAAVDAAVDAHDAPWSLAPTPHSREMDLRHGWDGEVGRFFLALDAGTTVGTGQVHTSEWDNLDLAWLELSVHPDHRRRGHGRALLDGLLDVVTASGRHLVGVDGWDLPATHAFAAATGWERRSQAINRRMPLGPDGVDLDLVRKLHDEAATAAVDYDLVRISGTTPDDLLPAVAELTGAINDAPLDDLEMEDEVYPPERVRRYEEAQRASGHRLRRLVARHRTSGALAGHTIVAVDGERPAYGDQHDTSVVAAHRGHRLGLLLKAAMVLWLAEEEPQLRWLDTWNAESNRWMIAVNEVLGYEVMGRGVQFQRRV